MICSLLHLISLIQHNVLELHAADCSSSLFLLLLNNILLHRYTTYCLPIYQLVDKHLVGFYVLAIIHNASMNSLIQVFVWTCLHFFWVDRQKRNNQMNGSFMFNFLRNYQTISQSDYHFTFPTARYDGTSFSTFFQTLVVCLLSDVHYSRGV